MIKFILLSLALLTMVSGCTTGASPGSPLPNDTIPMEEHETPTDRDIIEQERDTRSTEPETVRERLDEALPDIDTKLPRTNDIDTPMPRTDDLQTPTMPGVDMDKHSPGTDIDEMPQAERIR